MIKNLHANAGDVGDVGLIPASGRSPLAGDMGDAGLIPASGRSPGRGHSDPLWFSCLENPMDRGAWRGTVCGVAMS